MSGRRGRIIAIDALIYSVYNTKYATMRAQLDDRPGCAAASGGAGAGSSQPGQSGDPAGRQRVPETRGDFARLAMKLRIEQVLPLCHESPVTTALGLPRDHAAPRRQR